MSYLCFFQLVLKALDDGKVIRTSIAIALRILGVVAALGGLYLLVEMLKTSFRLPTTEGTIGGIVFSIIFVVAIISSMQIFFYRANSVKELGDSPFTVIPIVSILFRATGELYATFGTALGIGGCLFVWFSGFNPLELLGAVGGLFPSTSVGGTFASGLVFLVTMGVSSFLALVLFYFLAEATLLLADIARNIRLLVRNAGTTLPR